MPVGVTVAKAEGAPLAVERVRLHAQPRRGLGDEQHPVPLRRWTLRWGSGQDESAEVRLEDGGAVVEGSESLARQAVGQLGRVCQGVEGRHGGRAWAGLSGHHGSATPAGGAGLKITTALGNGAERRQLAALDLGARQGGQESG